MENISTTNELNKSIINNQILIKNGTNISDSNINDININNTKGQNILKNHSNVSENTENISIGKPNNKTHNKTTLNNTLINTYFNNLLVNSTLKETSSKNDTNNNLNQTNPFLQEKVKIPIINKKVDTKYALIFGISIPIIFILLIIFICYFIRKKIKTKMLSNPNNNIEQNKIHYKNSGKKQPYNRIQNTSGLNNNIGLNPNNLSEIKVQNMKEEFNNIMSNSGSSSGRRKREKKKKPVNNNMPGFDGREGQKGMQNEIKEQIKQYVIDEHNNNF